tara:strand:- start:19916 stop:20173 length:258 start_codon:yes stop_codon:yes gene_type:complete
MRLPKDIQACRICATRFGQTATAHQPRPVVWFDSPPRIVIAGQAPGARVHDSGKPFTDPCGRLARPCASGLPLATSVVAQYRLDQ